jgi:poly-gamma-glutamate capsule biosynthesis protein CapA/YwtB (metallophosphatase superfamily)
VAPTIAVLGDVMLGRKVGEALGHVPAEELWAPEVRALCRECDAVVLNLECCISERGEPTRLFPGKQFFFRAPPAAVSALESVGASAIGLANNHALDYGKDALLDTLDLVERAGIVVTGAGPDEQRARAGAVVPVNENRLGLLAVSDHPVEFAAAAGKPGIAFAELRSGVPEWLRGEIGRMREDCDVLIAFPHWGPNMTSEPASWQRRAAADLQAGGADLVAGHSAHCFHGIGWTDAGPVLFDLGDGLDDYAVDRRLRNDLGLLALWRPGDSDAELELVGLRLDFCHTRLAVGEDADWIADRLDRACRDLGTLVERAGEQRFLVRPG